MAQPGSTIYFEFTTYGLVDNIRQPKDADALPTAELLRNDAQDATAMTVTKVAGETGLYVASVAVPGGWSEFDYQYARAKATMDAVGDTSVLWEDKPATVDTESRSDIASKTEIEMANDLTGQAFRQQLADLIASDWVAGDSSAEAIASAVASNGTLATLIAASKNTPQEITDALKTVPTGGATAPYDILNATASNVGTTQAAVASLPDATGVQTAAEAAIDAKLPAGEAEIAAAGASATNLDEVSGGGGGTSAISPVIVSPKRTFYVGREGHRSSSVVTLQQAITSGKTVTLSIEPELNEGADIDINGSHAVTVVGDTTLEVANIATRPDGEAVHFDIPSDSAVDTYEVTGEVQTVDGQSVSLVGKLVIE